MFECEECGNAEFLVDRKSFDKLIVDGNGEIIRNEDIFYDDVYSEMMECTECGMEYPSDEVII